MAKTYDYAIIGSGLTGLTIAAKLSEFTNSILLIDGSDTYGGVNKPISFPNGIINNGIRHIPNTQLAKKAIEFLGHVLGTELINSVSDTQPVTYENSHLSPFVGFGNNSTEFFEEISYFINHSNINLNIEPREWPKLLFEKFKGEFQPKSFVTKFHCEGEKVTHVTINGSKIIQATNFIYCGNIKDLGMLLPEDAISARARGKLKKNLYWTAICLDICHNHVVTDNEAIHILNGTTQDEIGPCAGKFLKPVEMNGEKLQTSQWITFMDYEATDDTEAIAHALKKIKRQIKRPYPNALEGIKTERILISPIISGHGDLKLNANQTLPNVENLWVGSATAHPQRNITGALLQAELILASLGFIDAEASKAQTTESPAEMQTDIEVN